MTLYSQKSLNEYLDLVASEKKISKSELEKNISVKDFCVVRNAFLLPNFLKTEREFKEFIKERGYDAVVNIKRNFIPEYFESEYKISATGVKFKEN